MTWSCCLSRYRHLRTVCFTGVENTVQGVHGRGRVHRNPRGRGNRGTRGVDDGTRLTVMQKEQEKRGQRSGEWVVCLFVVQLCSTFFQDKILYLMFADRAHRSSASMLALRGPGSPHGGWSVWGSGAEWVGRCLTSCFVHAEGRLERVRGTLLHCYHSKGIM